MQCDEWDHDLGRCQGHFGHTGFHWVTLSDKRATWGVRDAGDPKKSSRSQFNAGLVLMTVLGIIACWVGESRSALSLCDRVMDWLPQVALTTWYCDHFGRSGGPITATLAGAALGAALWGIIWTIGWAEMQVKKIGIGTTPVVRIVVAAIGLVAIIILVVGMYLRWHNATVVVIFSSTLRSDDRPVTWWSATPSGSRTDGSTVYWYDELCTSHYRQPCSAQLYAHRGVRVHWSKVGDSFDSSVPWAEVRPVGMLVVANDSPSAQEVEDLPAR